MTERSWARRVLGPFNVVTVVGVVALAAAGVGCSSSQEHATPAVGERVPTGGNGESGGAAAGVKRVGRGETGAGVADPAATPTEASEEIRLAPDEAQPPLPDGTFTGRFQGDEAAVSVRLVVRDGMVLVAHVEVVGKRRTSLDLQPVVAADARMLRFQGRFGADYLRLKGRFVDDRRAAGTFEGQVDRKRVSGRWYALRR